MLHCGTFTSRPLVPEQLTAVWILLVVNGELQDAAEVERQPAQSEDQDQAEHCLSNLPSLDMHIKTRGVLNQLNELYVLKASYERPSDLLQVVAEGDLDAIFLPEHLTGHQGVEDSSAG